MNSCTFEDTPEGFNKYLEHIYNRLEAAEKVCQALKDYPVDAIPCMVALVEVWDKLPKAKELDSEQF